jgi:GTP cyclohydrolase I
MAKIEILKAVQYVVTSEFGGKFKEEQTRREFLDYIKLDTKF